MPLHRIPRLLPICGLLLVSLACGPLRQGLDDAETRTITVPVLQTGAAWGVDTTTFGVCVGLDGRGGRSFVWDHFLGLEGPEIQGLAGYAVEVTRGESCHHRAVNQFQALVKFDIEALPLGAVTRAQLRAVPRLDRATDAPAGPGTRAQCDILTVGLATSQWQEGTGNRLVTWRSIPPRQPAFGRDARFGPIDVTRAVRDWLDDDAIHRGFVITPRHDVVEANAETIEQENDAYVCDLLLGQYELDVTMLIPGSS